MSYEDTKKDILIGLLRLRKASKKFTYRKEFTSQQTSIVRGIARYMFSCTLHSRDPRKFQHQGFGTLLMEEAARIAREYMDQKKKVSFLVLVSETIMQNWIPFGWPFMSKWLNEEE